MKFSRMFTKKNQRNRFAVNILKSIFFVLLFCGQSFGQLSSDDIGSVGAAGSYTEVGGTYTVLGSGTDIWDPADEFHYVYISASGDCEISARVASVQNTSEWAQAGVMIRNTLNAGSSHATVGILTDGTLGFTSRIDTDGASTWNSQTGTSIPYYIRIVRTGDLFTSYYSLDGSNWTEYESVTIVMSSDVYIGLAVTSGDNSTLCTSVFDNVVIPNPVAEFTANNVLVGVGSTVDFTNASTNAATFSWSFEGGTPATSSDVNPSIQYSTIGTYQVSLTATSGIGVSDTETKTSYITVTTAPVDITNDLGTITSESGTNIDYLIDDDSDTDFEANARSCWITYQATNSYIASSYWITSRNDNNRDNDPFNWTFEGSNDGSNWITLDTKNSITFSRNQRQEFPLANSSIFRYYRLDISRTRKKNKDIQFAELEIYGFKVDINSDFSGTPTTIYRTQSVAFTNESVVALNYNWTFPGGTPGSSTDENPVVTYNSVGTYDVTLVADDGAGHSDSEVKSNYITVQSWPAPTADFSASATTIDNGGSINFTNSSTNATSYSWTFEGGTPSTSTDENPTSITYSNAGTYDVTLVSMNADGLTDTETKTDYITVNLGPIDITDDGGDISSETGSNPDNLDNLIDNNTGSNFYISPNGSFVQYDATINYIVSSYNITSSGYDQQYDPTAWELFGSIDGSSWTTLDSRSGQSFSSRYLTREFTITNSLSFKYFRLDLLTSQEGTYIASAELEIYGIPTPTAKFSASATAAYPGNSITFTNESVQATTYSWSFPGGTPNTSTDENPVVSYSSIGTYNVTLTIDDGSGTTDTELKTNYISIVSPPTPVPGAGHTYNFAGNSGNFKIPHDNSLNLPNKGTVEVWICINNYTQAGGIIHKGAGLYDQEYSLQLKLEEMPKITVDLGTAGDGFGREILLTNTQLQLNTYYHVAVTWDEATNTSKLYINGRLDDISYIDFTLNNYTGPLLLGVQDDPPVNDYAFDGIMDEVRIWNTDLSQVRIRDWMCKKITPSHPDWNHLQAYYRFENPKSGSSITLEDISLNDNNGFGLATTNLQYIWSPFPVGDDAVYTTDPLSSLYYTTAESDSLVLDYIIGDFNYAAIVYNDISPNFINVGGDIDDIFTDHYWDVWSDENSATFDFYYYYKDYQSSYNQDNFRLLSRNEPATNPWTDSYTTNNTSSSVFNIADMFLRQQFILGGSDAQPFTGNKYYVRPDGSNSNDGSTPATAWATVSFAASQAPGPRDTVFIATGSYIAFNVSHSGSTTFPVVFYGDKTGEYFDGYAGAGDINVGTGLQNYAGQISNQSNVTLQNINFQNGTQRGLYLDGTINIKVSDCEFNSNGSYGINAVGTSGYLKILNNEITSGSSSGIRIANSSGQISITSNEILKVSGSNLGNGIEIYETDFDFINKNAIVGVSNGISVTSCSVSGEIQENRIVNPTTYGVYVDAAQNGAIRNNLIYGDGSANASGVYMRDCDFNVINNTIDDVGDNGIYGDNCDDGIWKNNIVTNNNYGIYYLNGIPSVYYNCVSDNISTYYGNNAITSNPLYVDPDGADNATGIDNWRDDDFHIESNYGSYHGGAWTTDGSFSPCIDAGDPNDSYLQEPSDNGGRINCGRYGGTGQASLSGGMEEFFAAPDYSWIMLGVPMTPDDRRPIAVYGDDFGGLMPLTINGTDTTWNHWMCIRWEVNDTSSEYYEYGDGSEYQPPDCEPGISHFIYHDIAEIVNIDIDGVPVSDDISKELFKKPNTSWGPTAYGLNMLANPFRETVDMGSFRVVKGGTEYTISEAATNGWVSPYIYTWSYVSQNYDTHLINDPNDVYPIPKWQGFWFAQLDTDSDLQLKMPFSGRIGVNKALAKKQALDATDQLQSFGDKYYLKESSYDKKWDWFLKFGVVSQDYKLRDLENYVGVYDNATDDTDPWDGIDVSTISQMQDEYVELFMKHEDGGVFASDMHSSANDKNLWEINIRKASEQENYIFVWPHIRQVPQNIQLSLLDADMDTLVHDLRQAEGYNFDLIADTTKFFILSQEISDISEPQFTFTISQNHYLPEFVTLYIVPNEPLQDFNAYIDGVAYEYTKLNSPPNLYKLNFSIENNQLPDVDIIGIDNSGNQGNLKIEKGLNINFANVSTQTSSSIETKEFTVSFSENVFPRQTPVIVSNIPLEITYPTKLTQLSNPVSITPENLSFGNSVFIHYKEKMNYSDAELYKYTDNQWKYITAYSDEMEIPNSGIYALFSKSGNTTEESLNIAKDFLLDNPSPNPFNNSTVIRYHIMNGGNINLAIYNLLGERVALLDNKYLMQGKYEARWDGKNSQGNNLPSGLYFVKMQNAKHSVVKKITLLK